MGESSLSPQQQPFFYLTAAFVAGIVTDQFMAPVRWLCVLVLIAFTGTAIRFVRRKKMVGATLALLITFACVGALLSQAERTAVRANRLQQLFASQRLTADDPVELTGALALPPEPAPGAFFLDVEAESLRIRGEVTSATGRVRLLFPIADDQCAAEYRQLALAYGSRLRVLVRLEQARSYNNPGAPDFNEFLERQGYDLKGTIKSPLLVEPLPAVSVNRILAAIYQTRQRALAAVDAQFREPVAGTLKAMLLNNKYFLDPQVSERLRESCTFHTLVISGFHITVLAWVVLHTRLPIWSRKRRHVSRQRTTIPRVFVALLLLWVYTVMVGLAPPVTRATLMVSIGLFAPLLFRQAASLNTVSLAAFLMLALKPVLVADAGFQLSFLAVAGIVTIALPILSKLKSAGTWRPTALTPRPPSSLKRLRAFAECLYWDEREFGREMKGAPITYRLEKSPVARTLNRLRLQPIVRSVVALLVTSIAIQFTTLPLMIYYFNRVAPIGILLNITAGLLTGALMLFAILALAISAVQASAAVPFIWLSTLAHELLVNAINPFLEIPYMTFRVAHYEGWQAMIYAAYYLPLGILVAVTERWQFVNRIRAFAGQTGLSPAAKAPATVGETRPQRESQQRLALVAITTMVAFLGLLVALLQPPEGLPGGRLTVYFLDVGQGDSALVVFPQGTTMLVDGGGELVFTADRSRQRPGEEAGDEASEAPTRYHDFSVGEAVVSRFLWSQGLTHLDYMLATHADADHLGGLIDVVKNFPVAEALIGRLPEEPTGFAIFSDALARRQVPLALLRRGERFDLDGVQVEVLHPTSARQTASKSANNDSVVLRLVYGSTAILLTGDIERETEAGLVKSGQDVRADVIKVPHHGSKTSSTSGFLDAVQPRYAVISVGQRSRFGHPHASVIARYTARGVQLLQTGRRGMVTVQSDGTTVSVRTAQD